MSDRKTAERERKNLPYAPELRCICDDWECCGSDGGTWLVNCQFCKQVWPCADYIATHTASEVRRAKRYTNARTYPEWPEVEDSPYEYMDRFDRWLRTGSSANKEGCTL